MSDEWYYKRGESAFGPVGGAMLHDLIRRGRLRDDTLVRRDGTEKWITVAQARPSLPPVAEAALSSSRAVAEPPRTTQALPFDSTLPGASVLYAPPQSAAASHKVIADLPVWLWAAVVVATTALLLTVVAWLSVGLFHISYLSSADTWPAWLQAMAGALVEGMEVTSMAAQPAKILGLAIWQGCAFASLRRLYGESMVRRGRASGLWWLVPLANLIMPFLCLRDLRYFSRKRRDFPNPHASFGPLLVTFETLMITGMLINTASRVLAMRGARLADEISISSRWMSLLNCANGIALAAVLIAIVIGNFLQQRELRAHWNDDEHWKGR